MKSIKDIIDEEMGINEASEMHNYVEKSASEFMSTFKILPSRERLSMSDYLKKFLSVAFNKITGEKQEEFIAGVQDFLKNTN